MKAVTILSLVVLSLVCTIAAEEGYKAKHKFDQKILRDQTKLQAFFNCLMDTAPCDDGTAELKQYLPEAMKTNCQKCSSEQKEGFFSTIKYLSEKEPKIWNAIEAKYDPEGLLKKE